ncbi:MAG: hypothetical protein HYY16_18880 [Planctomycetes bacterium]|nr:hypothetical protein [Planctomycetota bacterium]
MKRNAVIVAILIALAVCWAALIRPAARQHAARTAPSSPEPVHAHAPAEAPPQPIAPVVTMPPPRRPEAEDTRAPMEPPAVPPPVQPSDAGGAQAVLQAQRRWYDERLDMISRHLELSDDQRRATDAAARAFVTESENLRYQVQNYPVSRSRIPEIHRRMETLRNELLEGMRPHLSVVQMKKLEDYFTSGAFEVHVRGVAQKGEPR